MTAGLQVINDGGIWQIDELYRNYLYTGQSWTFTTIGDHTFTTTSGRVAPQLVFYSTAAASVDSNGHTNGTGGITFLGSTVSGTTWTYKVNGIGTCYLFDLQTQAQATGTGLQVFDGSNNCVFDSGNTPLVIRDNKSFSGSYAFRYYYPIQTLNTSGGCVEVNGGVAYTKPTSQTWGWLADSTMHVQAWYFENTHAAGGPPNGDGNDHKFLGAIYAAGDTFKVAARDYLYTGSYVSWGIGSGWGPTPILFIDLTNIIAGGGGGGTAVSTSMSPGNQSQSAAATSHTFGGENMAVSGGTVQGYSWTMVSPTGGTWTLDNNSTATTAATVTGVASGATATAIQRCQATVGGVAYIQDASLSFTNTTGGGGGTVTVSALSPGNNTVTGSSSTTFAAESVTVTGGSTITYTWSVSGTGGTWTINSGQNTFSAAARVTGVAVGATATGTLTCNVVVDGTSYPRSCTLSLTNNATGGVTFNPVPGTYNNGLDTFSVTASSAVVWTWTKTGSTGRNSTVPTTSGTSATSFSTTQTDTLAGASTVCTIALSANGSTWNITVTSPGGGGGGTGCVTADTFLPNIGQAMNVKVGDELVIANPKSFTERKGVVSRADPKMAECVRIRTKSGIELDCSKTAPIATKDGSLVLAPDLEGHVVPVCDHGKYRYEPVASVTDIGEQLIVHITCEDDLFLAGKQQGRYLLHHNVKA
jgi:hypothetical protein